MQRKVRTPAADTGDGNQSREPFPHIVRRYSDLARPRNRRAMERVALWYVLIAAAVVLAALLF